MAPLIRGITVHCHVMCVSEHQVSHFGEIGRPSVLPAAGLEFPHNLA